jgi:hypothetical protein
MEAVREGVSDTCIVKIDVEAAGLREHEEVWFCAASMLTYAGVCWRMLTHADVCWRMLTYAVGMLTYSRGERCGCAARRMLTYAHVC